MRSNVLLILFLVSGCKSLPKVPWGLINGPECSIDIKRPESEEVVTVPISQVDKWVCSSPDGIEKIINACRNTDK